MQVSFFYSFSISIRIVSWTLVNFCDPHRFFKQLTSLRVHDFNSIFQHSQQNNLALYADNYISCINYLLFSDLSFIGVWTVKMPFARPSGNPFTAQTPAYPVSFMAQPRILSLSLDEIHASSLTSKHHFIQYTENGQKIKLDLDITVTFQYIAALRFAVSSKLFSLELGTHFSLRHFHCNAKLQHLRRFLIQKLMLNLHQMQSVHRGT